MRVTHMKWVVIVASGALFVANQARASLFEPVSDQQLVCEATDVIKGQVTDVQSAWDGDRTAIWTTATVKVSDVIRGTTSRDAIIRVKEVGGTVDDYTIHAEGFPTFRKDEEVVLFLQPWEDDPGTYRVWGYGRGLFAVVRPQGRPPVAYRHDVVESGQPALFTDQLPPVGLLEVLNRQLVGFAQRCERGGR